MAAIPELQIDLIAYNSLLKYKMQDGTKLIWDPCRKIWLQVTREEIVRQLWIAYLIHNHGISKNRIISEKLVTINALKRRFDILVMDSNLSPTLLVECKAPEIDIDQSVFDQISIYNIGLKAPYMLVSNGLRSIMTKVSFSEKKYTFCREFPILKR